MNVAGAPALAIAGEARGAGDEQGPAPRGSGDEAGTAAQDGASPPARASREWATCRATLAAAGAAGSRPRRASLWTRAGCTTKLLAGATGTRLAGAVADAASATHALSAPLAPSGSLHSGAASEEAEKASTPRARPSAASCARTNRCACPPAGKSQPSGAGLPLSSST